MSVALNGIVVCKWGGVGLTVDYERSRELNKTERRGPREGDDSNSALFENVEAFSLLFVVAYRLWSFVIIVVFLIFCPVTKMLSSY